MSTKKIFSMNPCQAGVGGAGVFDIEKNRRGLIVSANNDNSDGGNDKTGVGVATKVRTKTKRPNLYRVLLLNDDFTPQEFVVVILMDIFNKSSEEAHKIMMHVHVNGIGECGVFPYEIAETKVMLVMDAAQKSQHPLQCVMEKK